MATLSQQPATALRGNWQTGVLILAAWVQGIVVGLLLLSVLTQPANFVHLGWFVYSLPLGLLCMAVALWHFFRVKTKPVLTYVTFLTAPVGLGATLLLGSVANKHWLADSPPESLYSVVLVGLCALLLLGWVGRRAMRFNFVESAVGTGFTWALGILVLTLTALTGVISALGGLEQPVRWSDGQMWVPLLSAATVVAGLVVGLLAVSYSLVGLARAGRAGPWGILLANLGLTLLLAVGSMVPLLSLVMWVADVNR